MARKGQKQIVYTNELRMKVIEENLKEGKSSRYFARKYEFLKEQ